MNIPVIINSWACSSLIIDYFNKTEQNESYIAIKTPILKLFVNLACYMKCILSQVANMTQCHIRFV